MNKIIITTVLCLALLIMAVPAMAAAPVAPKVLFFNTGITSDGVELPGSLYSYFTVTTNGVQGTMHGLGLTETIANPALKDGNYAFSLKADAAQQNALKNYFAAKANPPWGSAWQTQIDSEISGLSPFFFLSAASRVYSLVDNFKLSEGLSPTTLTIDDDYPVGVYVYKGTLTGTNGATLAVTVTLKVVRAKPKLTTVHVYNLQPSWTAVGGGGVYSAYYGPPDYVAVSPGTTAIYHGREAGIIKAGLAVDPTYGDYEDQGLFAFKPGDTPIATFATQPLKYDFVNQHGTLPVWVYIELNKNVSGDIIYQYVPTTNPAAWHTEDAASGKHWQAWTDLFSGITTGPMLSLADIAAGNPGKTVSRVYLTLGMGDAYHGTGSGTVAWVDTVTIGTTTYDFVVAEEHGQQGQDGQHGQQDQDEQHGQHGQHGR